LIHQVRLDIFYLLFYILGDTMTALVNSPYKFSLSKDAKGNVKLQVETGKLILDSARLLKAEAYIPGSKPTFYVRGLLSPKTEAGKKFYNEYLSYERQLLTSKNMLHENFLPKEYDPKKCEIFKSTLRLGSSIIQDAKDYDEKFAEEIEQKKEKKKYHDNMDYLNDFAVIRTSTNEEFKDAKTGEIRKIVVPIVDKFGANIISQLTEDMISPAFYGRLSITVKITKTEKGERLLKAYLNSVIYLGKADPRHCFVSSNSAKFSSETVDDNSMFDESPAVPVDDIDSFINGDI